LIFVISGSQEILPISGYTNIKENFIILVNVYVNLVSVAKSRVSVTKEIEKVKNTAAVSLLGVGVCKIRISVSG
jgi:hypothetical protein